VTRAIQESLGRPVRSQTAVGHTSPATFHAGQALEISMTPEKAVAGVTLFYRHVDQAERYQSVPMEARNRRYHAEIPGAYTNSQYPVEYYFEVRESPMKAWIYPGLSPSLTQQPYFVVRRA